MDNIVSLQEMLDFRDTKVMYMQKLRCEFKNSILVTLSMNIPGPHKTSDEIYYAFQVGKSLIKNDIIKNDYIILKETEYKSKAGYLEYYVLNTLDTKSIKKIMTEIEDNHPLGRLFDIDVYWKNGIGISRNELGLLERKCLVCGKSAKECGRSRAHSIEVLESKVHEIIGNFNK